MYEKRINYMYELYVQVIIIDIGTSYECEVDNFIEGYSDVNKSLQNQ